MSPAERIAQLTAAGWPPLLARRIAREQAHAAWLAHQEWVRAAAATIKGSTLSQPDALDTLIERVVSDLAQQ